MSHIEITSRKQSDCVRVFFFFFVLNPLAFIFINLSKILQIHTGTLNLLFQFNSITILNYVKGDETQLFMEHHH